MTNHGETTGSFGNDDITGRVGHTRPDAPAGGTGGSTPPADRAQPVTTADPGSHQITLRGPAELADALPYLLGYRPEDSIVMAALHDRDGRGRFGGRARLGIPSSEEDWPSAARQLAHGLIKGSERRGAKPEQIVVYVCQEPRAGETGRQVMDRLRPLARHLRVESGLLDVPVIEALCISGGRFWSYCCDQESCCPPEGRPMGLPGTSVLAAAATYAGLQVRGTLRDLHARLQPWETAAALQQEVALDTAGMALVPRILDTASRATVAEETLDLARRVMRRLKEAPPVSGTLTADLRDDELITHDEAATLILGLQDRLTRDRAAEWMEGDEAAPALRLWRALARRCVGPYGEHAAAPLALAGWVAWSTGDELEAREALAMALGADPGYLFARLLHQACNEGLDPESLRRCLRAERADREGSDRDQAAAGRGQEASGRGAQDCGTEEGTAAKSGAEKGGAEKGGAEKGGASPEGGTEGDTARDRAEADADADSGADSGAGVGAGVGVGVGADSKVSPGRAPAARTARGTRVSRPRAAGTRATGTRATGKRGAAPGTVRTDGARPRRTPAKEAVRRRGTCSSAPPQPANDPAQDDS
ncbi:DUF4192 domain-containing protein [Streptomyces sp. enrichment culture]|uniref:DUF4192 domain-containing protein n=1 Tax=Streptomyces sp. enrichment culture TaxID=1795815 RepID=UPI003F559637